MELIEIKEELKNKKEILGNVIKAIISTTEVKEAISEIEEDLTPGIYDDCDFDSCMRLFEDLKLDLETMITNLEEKIEYIEMNPQWRKERQQQEKEYWNTQF